MRRVVLLGRGGAGKSTFATRLGAALDLPVVELDALFWPPDLAPMPAERWAEVQEQLAGESRWILDGDLGPYDVLKPRLEKADTVVVLDFPLWRCAWRALRRGKEDRAFWHWLVTYRRRALPVVDAALAEHAKHATVHRLRNPRAVEGFLSRVDQAPT
ncbi:DNA topology modulation protein FlaR [Amycolatopsis sp. DSM 110486]|uniref:DNA topology modulation protein FlaR n=1 Tax=Amycolatopsis sp. DSM 110486 TaxID=2865832 RepID=UPI001C6A24B0|nr:DNA topology modulation protein FlaR [Amycolatopsis sp. DSM 110486]QYN18367.1 DNA topology modulation protein FlaR [Amycolatopsis sp. DSM 110486]